MSEQHSERRYYYWRCATRGCGWPNTEPDFGGRPTLDEKQCRKCNVPALGGQYIPIIEDEDAAYQQLRTYYAMTPGETFDKDYILTSPPRIPYEAPGGRRWEDYVVFTEAGTWERTRNYWTDFNIPPNLQENPYYTPYAVHEQNALASMSPDERSIQALQDPHHPQPAYYQIQNPFGRPPPPDQPQYLHPQLPPHSQPQSPHSLPPSYNQPQSHYGQQPPSNQPRNLPAQSYNQPQAQPQRGPMPPPSAPDIEFIDGGVVPRRGEKRKPREPPASSGDGSSSGRKKRH